MIPRDYPEVSSNSIDRTTQGSLMFFDMCATLNIHPVQGWSVEPDKKVVKHEVGHACTCTLKITFLHFQILRSEVDQPEMEKFRAEDLHDYPPRIICRFFPEENAPKRTTCTISLSGLQPLVEFHLHLHLPTSPTPIVPLKALTPKVAVDTTKLQVFTFVQCSLLKWCSGYLWLNFAPCTVTN